MNDDIIKTNLIYEMIFLKRNDSHVNKTNNVKICMNIIYKNLYNQQVYNFSKFYTIQYYAKIHFDHLKIRKKKHDGMHTTKSHKNFLSYPNSVISVSNIQSISSRGDFF